VQCGEQQKKFISKEITIANPGGALTAGI